MLPDLAAALRELVAESLLPGALIPAHERLTRFLIAARLLAPAGDDPSPAAREALALACEYDDWDTLLAGLQQARAAVAAAWQDNFGEQLETQ